MAIYPDRPGETAIARHQTWWTQTQTKPTYRYAVRPKQL